MISQKQKKLVEEFLRMHTGGDMFVLPNVWDAGSARVFEKQGFNAVAMTSAGIAYSMGYPDGEHITLDDLAYCVKNISRRINIPLSVDFERGYSEDPQKVKDNAKRLIECGAVGFNIEDGLPSGELSPIEEQTEKIKALSELKQELDIPFVINARTCAYWLKSGEEEPCLQTAIDRANVYAEAGADCSFIPGAMDQLTVKELVQNINTPINIILNPVFNDLRRLDELGVKRLSIGSSAVRNMFGRAITIADELKSDSTDTLLATEFSYSDANRYFK